MVEFETRKTDRFLLRWLEESDVTNRYVEWFDEERVRRFIVAARRSSQSLESLRAYIRQRRDSDNAVMLGIFDLANHGLIATLKFEPIEFDLGAANVGVMVGEPGWRGKGLFGEIFRSAAQALNDAYGIRHFRIGVEVENEPAIKAYRKAGFDEGTAHPLEPRINFSNQIFLFTSLPAR